MMKTYLIPSAVALAAAFAAVPAMAQDRDSHFDGFYISGAVGTTMQSNDGAGGLAFDTNLDGTYGDSVNLASPPAAPATSAFVASCGGVALGTGVGDGCRNDKNKIEYAGRIGFDKRLGNNFVAGALFEASKNNSRDGSSGFSSTPASYAFDRKLDYALSLRARAGFTPGGGALFYATGGGSYAKIDHSFSVIGNPAVPGGPANDFTEVRDNKRVWGWQAGGGAEVMLTDNISLGLEYLYNRYNDNKYYVAVTQGTAPATNPFIQASAGGTNMRPAETRYDFHSVRASLSFQF